MVASGDLGVYGLRDRWSLNYSSVQAWPRIVTQGLPALEQRMKLLLAAITSTLVAVQPALARERDHQDIANKVESLSERLGKAWTTFC